MSHLLFFRTGCCTYIVNVGNIFRQGVYLTENTSQAASVEFVRQQRTNYARSRLQKLAESPEGVFRQAHTMNIVCRFFV